MANPGEEMVCGQCGQTILGKAMKVIVSSSSCASINMLIIISTFQVRQKKSILRLTWKRRLVRNIGTNITSSAATAEWGSEETAKWGKLSSSKNQIEENYLHLYQSSKASKYQRIKEEKWRKSSPPKRVGCTATQITITMTLTIPLSLIRTISITIWETSIEPTRCGKKRAGCTATRITRRSSSQDAPTAVDSYLGSSS